MSALSKKHVLPPFRVPWRWDLYRALHAALSISSRADRGDARAKELYRRAKLIAKETGEELSKVVLALAALEADMVQAATPFQALQPISCAPSPRRPSHNYQPSLFG